MYKIARLKMYALLIAALFLQVTALNHLKLFGSKPDVVLLSVIFFGLFSGEGAGLESGIIAGLLKDLFSLDFFFINTFILAVIGLLSGMMGGKFSKESAGTQFVLVLSFSFFSMSLHFILASVFSRAVILRFSEYLTASVLPASIYTAAISIPVYSKLTDIYELKEMEDLL